MYALCEAHGACVVSDAPASVYIYITDTIEQTNKHAGYGHILYYVCIYNVLHLGVNMAIQVKNKVLTVRIDESLLRRLEALAKAHNRTSSDMVRQVILTNVEGYERHLKQRAQMAAMAQKSRK